MKDLKKAKRKILAAKRIVISGHINPDGDSIGSLLSLGLGLEKLGKQVYMICQDRLPAMYRRLPGAKRIKKKIAKSVDLAIAVDCGGKELLGSTFETFKNARDILEIDHHEFRRPFGNTELVDTQAAAVGELIYVLLKELKVFISKDIAQNLLTSIVVETNSFRLPNVRAFTFEVCAQLVKTGLNFYKLVDMVYWSKNREAALLSGLSLARCQFIKNGRIAWSIVKKRDFEKAKGKTEDVDAVVEEMRSIKGVKIAALFREQGKNRLRVSLRSKGKINIARIAESYAGGGHFDVAGCYIPNNAKSISGLLSRLKDLLR